MRILNIEVEEFGKLNGLCLEPSAGLTLIEGENESGKSTLLAFLRFVLYGFPRRNGPEGEERDKRISWRGRTAAGAVTLETGGTVYRIVRRAYLRGGAKESTVEELSVLRMPEGVTVTTDGKTPGEYFLGLPAELYDGSLCMAQSGADRVCAAGVGEAMNDLLFAGELPISAEEAEAKLQQARRDLQHLKGRGGRIAELEDELSAVEGALAHAGEDAARLSRLRAQVADLHRQLRESRAALSQATDALEGIGIDRTLTLFDDCARARAEQERCHAALLAEREAGVDGLPDQTVATHAAGALRRWMQAASATTQAAAEVDSLRAIRQNEGLLEGARQIKALGGTSATLSVLEKKRRKAKRRAVTGVLFAILAIAAASVAYFLPTVRIYAFGGAALAACAALLFVVGAVTERHRRKQLLHALGAGDQAMLRTRLEQCLQEQAILESHRVRLEQAEQRLREACAERDDAGTTLRRLLAEMGKEALWGDPAAITAYLEQAVNRQQQWQSACSQASIAYERAKSVSEALSHRLQGIDEHALRARRAALPHTCEDAETLRGKQALLQRSVAELEESCAKGERAVAALSATVGDPAALERERNRVAGELEEARHKLAAIRLALEALEQATEELRRSVTPRLQRSAAALFAEMTDSAHGALRLSSDFSITLEEGGIPRPLSHFSAGCRDAAHLSLRLALLEGFSGERLPLFFDEALARLDDRRAEALLEILIRYTHMGGQCLLFTCHSREWQMLKSREDVKRFFMP